MIGEKGMRKGLLVACLVMSAMSLIGCAKGPADGAGMPEVPDPGVTSWNGFKEAPEELNKITRYVSEMSQDAGPLRNQGPLGAPGARAPEKDNFFTRMFTTEVKAVLLPVKKE